MTYLILVHTVANRRPRRNKFSMFQFIMGMQLWLARQRATRATVQESNALLPDNYVKRLVRRWHYLYFVLPLYHLTKLPDYLGVCWVLGVGAARLYVWREGELAQTRHTLYRVAIRSGHIPARLAPDVVSWVVERLHRSEQRAMEKWLFETLLQTWKRSIRRGWRRTF